MSRVQGWLWKCDRQGCGYVWHTQGEEPPKCCAKCKARNWNAGKGAEPKPPVTVEKEVKAQPKKRSEPKVEVEAMSPCRHRLTICSICHD
jgi:hypothetical protein